MNPESEVPIEKVSDLYAAQISANMDEKIGDMYRLLQDNKLPRYGSTYRILEMGTGGGDSFVMLKYMLSNRNDIMFIGADYIGIFARQFRNKVGSPAVIAESGNLPFGDHTLSGINASAIFHEVSTYGVRDRCGQIKRGSAALVSTMQEMARTLLPDGVLTYRDVHCPENQTEIKRVVYYQKSWHLFVKKYLPRLIEIYEKVITPVSGRIHTEQRGENLCIEAPIQIHREIQRHYITFRDYFRRVVAPVVGIDVTHEEWIDQSAGVKRHTVIFSSMPRVLRISIESSTYDGLTDALITEFFETPALDDWFKREGMELYTLLNLRELVALAEHASVKTAHGTYRLMHLVGSAHTSSRCYYERYLKQVIDQPELEAKQHLQFINTQQQGG